MLYTFNSNIFENERIRSAVHQQEVYNGTPETGKTLSNYISSLPIES